MVKACNFGKQYFLIKNTIEGFIDQVWPDWDPFSTKCSPHWERANWLWASGLWFRLPRWIVPWWCNEVDYEESKLRDLNEETTIAETFPHIKLNCIIPFPPRIFFVFFCTKTYRINFIKRRKNKKFHRLQGKLEQLMYVNHLRGPG